PHVRALLNPLSPLSRLRRKWKSRLSRLGKKWKSRRPKEASARKKSQNRREAISREVVSREDIHGEEISREIISSRVFRRESSYRVSESGWEALSVVDGADRRLTATAPGTTRRVEGGEADNGALDDLG